MFVFGTNLIDAEMSARDQVHVGRLKSHFHLLQWHITFSELEFLVPANQQTGHENYPRDADYCPNTLGSIPSGALQLINDS